MKRTLAIIGTAGRGQDSSMLQYSHWNQMTKAALAVLESEEDAGNPVTDLVSGGAAWADHIAIRVHKTYPWKRIHLFLPKRLSDRLTAQSYHASFSHELDLPDTWQQVLATPHTDVGSFKDGNTCVANAADVFLAMTFGNGPVVKDGGTADTVAKMLARGVEGYHLDLWTGTLHKGARLS